MIKRGVGVGGRVGVLGLCTCACGVFKGGGGGVLMSEVPL